MSEAYEAVVFVADSGPPLNLSTLASHLPVRLVRLSDGVFGIYRVAGKCESFDAPAIEALAAEVSRRVGTAVAVFYDNAIGLRSAVLYAGGSRRREFGAADEWWCPLDEAGRPVEGGALSRGADMLDDEEYDCAVSAMDAALEAIGAGHVKRGVLVDAFCYYRAEVLESR